MTIEIEAPARVCIGSRHGASQDAYRHGCRHVEAVAAHEVWLADLARSAEEVGCTSGTHDSNLAWLAGCRHPKAIAAHRKAVARKHDTDAVRRGREYSRLYDEQSRRIERRTGGVLYRDPRSPWRGGHMAVDRNNLFMLIHGIRDEPTRGELIAAVARSQGVLVPDSAFLPRPINNQELARKLGMANDREVMRMREARVKLRKQRTARRLADVRWRAAIAAVAPARKERERVAHETAAKRRADRGQAACE